MRGFPLLLLTLLAGMATTQVASAGTIHQSLSLISPEGPDPAVYEYQYTFTGFDLLANQDIQILFPADIYASLLPGDANPSSDWFVYTFQPNNPPGEAGLFDIQALVDHPSLAGPFSIQFTTLFAFTPQPQEWRVVQYDSLGNFVSTLETGTTTSGPPSSVPEPGTWTLFGASAACFLLRRALA